MQTGELGKTGLRGEKEKTKYPSALKHNILIEVNREEDREFDLAMTVRCLKKKSWIVVNFLIMVYFKMQSDIQTKKDLRLIGFNLIYFVREFLLFQWYYLKSPFDSKVQNMK